MKKIKNIIFGILSIMLCLTLSLKTSLVAFASTDHFEITVKCASSDSSVIMAGNAFEIYQIADAELKVLDTFASIKNSGDEPAYAKALADYVKANRVDSTFKKTADKNGEFTFDTDRGIYLVVGQDIVIDEVTYSPVPYIIALDKDTYAKLTSYVKYKSTAPEKPSETGTEEDTTVDPGTEGDANRPGPSETGDHANMKFYIPLFIISIIMIGVLLYIKKKSDSED